MNHEIRLDETFGSEIPERPKTPTMSEAEQRERYGASVADVERNQRDGESFADAARRLARERAQAEVREAAKTREQPTPEQRYRESERRDQLVREHLREHKMPMSKYNEAAQTLGRLGYL